MAELGPLDPVALDRVLRDTVAAMEGGRKQVCRIAEQARKERQETAQALEQVRLRVGEVIARVEELSRLQQQARLRLVEISRHFNRYGEEAYRSAYEEAWKLHEQWARAQEREVHLRSQRDQLERRLRRLDETLRRADEVAAQIALALDLLSGGLSHLAAHGGDGSRPSQVGLMALQAQEEERHRLARDLHDGPAQVLATVGLRVELCQRLLDEQPERAREEMERLRQLIRESLQEVRQVIFQLRPVELDQLGLVPALRRYLAGQRERTGLRVQLVTRGEPRRFHPALEIGVFRIIQEALNNVAKHAGTDRAVVRLEFAATRFWAEVADEGRGFDPDAAVRPDCFGLATMRERAERMNGRLEILSSPGRGTRVRLEIPMGREGGHHDDSGVDR